MSSTPRRQTDVARLAAVLSNVALLALLLVPLQKFAWAVRDDILAYDFRQAFLPAAEALLDGRSPYPELGYPPLVAFLSVPFVAAPATDILVTLAVAACVPASLWLLGVRDWRCYVAAFLWISVFNAIQTANVTLPILLAASVCWRWRDRAVVTSVAGGLAVAVKIIAWPLAFWLAITRRLRAAVGVLVVAVGVTIGLWATLGFSGLVEYPDSLGRLEGAQSGRGYTLQALMEDAGFADVFGVVSAVGCLLLALLGVALYARAGDEKRSFACAVVAVIVASPIIWLHSFALLLAPVALLRPRLSVVWFLPAVLALVSPGTGNGAPWQTVVTVGVSALVVVLVLLPADWASGRLRPRRTSGARASRSVGLERS
jgi:glycosyl transferase family 87